MATGGSVESISLDGRVFAATADTDPGRKIGGFENEIQPNGDGTARMVKTRVAWSLTDVSISVDDTIDDDTFIQELIDGDAFIPITISMASGTVYQGTGQVTGENPTSAQSTSKTVNLGGPGQLTRQ